MNKKPATPVIILVRPQLGENIGAVARAMSNFGLKELRLVAPRDGWPNRKAQMMAAGGESIIASAKVFPDTASAMADIEFAYGTTARDRDIEKRMMTVEEAMQEIAIPPTPTLPHKGGGNKVALVFGPERTGLENNDIGWCDALVTIPTAPDNTSLNLAQSAVVVMYEWFKKSAELRVQSAEKKAAPLSTQHSALATKSDWNGLFEQLDQYLEETHYYRVAHKKRVMWQNMKNMLMRGHWSEQEIRTFRGMLRVLYEGRQPRKDSKKRQAAS